MNDDIAAIVGKGWTLEVFVAPRYKYQRMYVEVQCVRSGRTIAHKLIGEGGDDHAGILAQVLAEVRRRVESA